MRLTNKQKIITGLMIMALSAVMLVVFPTALADGEETATTVMNIIHRVLQYVTTIIGVLMLITGIISFVISRQEENGPNEHKSIVKMAVGLILIILFTMIINDEVWNSLVSSITG